MKLAVQLVLFLFISFLSVPTIVTIIEKSSDISVFYNFAEEEITKHVKVVKVVKVELKLIYTDEPVDFLYTTKKEIISENLSKHVKVLEEIFSPPPELI